jgi:hypothetical protein
MRAALVYQRATSERDRKIAAGMDKRIAKQQGKKAAKPSRPKRHDGRRGGTANAS